MKLRKLKHKSQAKWRPRFHDIIRRAYRKHYEAIAKNVMTHNPLFRRLTSVK